MGFCDHKLSGLETRTIYVEMVDDISEKVKRQRERETSAIPGLGVSGELWIENYLIKDFLEIESGTTTYGFVTDIIGGIAWRNQEVINPLHSGVVNYTEQGFQAKKK